MSTRDKHSIVLLALKVIGEIEYTPEEALFTLGRLVQMAQEQTDEVVLTAFEDVYEKVVQYL